MAKPSMQQRATWCTRRANRYRVRAAWHAPWIMSTAPSCSHALWQLASRVGVRISCVRRMCACCRFSRAHIVPGSWDRGARSAPRPTGLRRARRQARVRRHFEGVTPLSGVTPLCRTTKKLPCPAVFRCSDKKNARAARPRVARRARKNNTKRRRMALGFRNTELDLLEVQWRIELVDTRSTRGARARGTLLWLVRVTSTQFLD